MTYSIPSPILSRFSSLNHNCWWFNHHFSCFCTPFFVKSVKKITIPHAGDAVVRDTQDRFWVGSYIGFNRNHMRIAKIYTGWSLDFFREYHGWIYGWIQYVSCTRMSIYGGYRSSMMEQGGSYKEILTTWVLVGEHVSQATLCRETLRSTNSYCMSWDGIVICSMAPTWCAVVVGPEIPMDWIQPDLPEMVHLTNKRYRWSPGVTHWGDLGILKTIISMLYHCVRYNYWRFCWGRY